MAELDGNLDPPFMGKETEAQRGRGLVLSHVAVHTKSHP